jgi:membrane protease YdiL (CAAX protease family)
MASSGNEEVPGGAPESGGDRPQWPGSGYSQMPPGPRVHQPPTPLRAALPETRSDATVWVVCAAVGFLVGQIVALIAIAVAAGITGNGNRLASIENLAAPPAWYIGSGLVGLWAGFFLGPVLASRVRGTKHLAADLGVAFRPADLWGIAIGIGGQVLVTLLYLPFISHLSNFNAPTTKLTGGAHGASFLVISVLTVVGAPFFEELFFRGLLLRGLLGLFGATGSRASTGAVRVVLIGLAVVLDGLLFGLAHGELEQLAGLAVFGCILAVVALKTQRLGMNMVSHATFNLVAVLAIVSNRSGVIH